MRERRSIYIGIFLRLRFRLVETILPPRGTQFVRIVGSAVRTHSRRPHSGPYGIQIRPHSGPYRNNPVTVPPVVPPASRPHPASCGTRRSASRRSRGGRPSRRGG